MTAGLVSVAIECVPGALVDALLAIEHADMAGVYDAEQHARLAPIVLSFRQALDEHIAANP